MKHFLYFVLILIMLLPGIQKKFSICKEKPLNGAITLNTPDPFTRSNWFSGRFQQTYGNSFNEVIGYKPLLVRLINQINFSFFNQSSVDYIVVGKEGYLYTNNYIDAYTGKDKCRKGDLEKKVSYIYKLQKYLENKGIHFILVFAPSKARIFPEYIPSRFLSHKKGITNYEEYIRIIRQGYPDLHVLDINNYFLHLKKNTGFPLYTKGGIHWTLYAMNRYFVDTLLHYMGDQAGKPFPEMSVKNLHWSDRLIWPDDDMMQVLNLAYSPGNIELPYADFAFGKGDNSEMPRLLVISDSYYSMLHGSSSFNSLFKKNDFWFYNKTRKPSEHYNDNNDPVFLRDDILDHDFVILMATEINISDFFLFPENALSWFSMGDKDVNERIDRIQYYINAIHNNPEWFNDIKKQATKANKPLEELVRDNAEYMERIEHKTGQKK